MNTVNKAAKNAKTSAQGLRILQSFAPKFSSVLNGAPSALKPDIQIVVAASRTALAKGNLSYLGTDKVAAAGARLSATCH